MIVANYRVFSKDEVNQSIYKTNFAKRRASGEPFSTVDNASEETGPPDCSDPQRGDEEEPDQSARRLYVAHFLETKHVSETIPALRSIINEANDVSKCKAVYRMHGDRASELTGEAVTDYFEERGIRATETA